MMQSRRGLRHASTQSASGGLICLSLQCIQEMHRRASPTATGCAGRHSHRVSLASNQIPTWPAPPSQRTRLLSQYHPARRYSHQPLPPTPPGLIELCLRASQPPTGLFAALSWTERKGKKERNQVVDRPQGSYLLQRHTWRVHGERTRHTRRSIGVGLYDSHTPRGWKQINSPPPRISINNNISPIPHTIPQSPQQNTTFQ